MLYAQQHSVVSGTEFGGEFAGVRVPDFAIAGTACAVGTFADDFIPEVFGDIAVAAIAGEFVVAGGGDDLRNVRVDVEALQLVAM